MADKIASFYTCLDTSDIHGSFCVSVDNFKEIRQEDVNLSYFMSLGYEMLAL